MLVGSGKLLRTSIAVNLAAMLLLAAYVLIQAYPSTEAVRLRNALLMELGTLEDFSWTPDRMPASFKAEQHAPPPAFVSALREAGVESASGDWEKALALAGILTRNAQDKGPIQSDLTTTYRAIVDDGRGYCADFVKVYLGLAEAAGLVVRRWSFSFDGFGGDGHTLVEVFDRQRNKWVFLDVYNNVHAVDATSGEPLSALEFREFALGRRPATIIRPNGPGRPGYKIESKLVDYYRRGAGEWYLLWGDNELAYDSNPAVRVAGQVSHSLEQLVAVALGVQPRIRALVTTENTPQLERMEKLRWRLLASAALFAALFVLLAVQVVLLARHGRAQEAFARTSKLLRR